MEQKVAEQFLRPARFETGQGVITGVHLKFTEQTDVERVHVRLPCHGGGDEADDYGRVAGGFS
jgi:hypothetical protein